MAAPLAVYLLPMLNAALVPGRATKRFLASQFGRTNRYARPWYVDRGRHCALLDSGSQDRLACCISHLPWRLVWWINFPAVCCFDELDAQSEYVVDEDGNVICRWQSGHSLRYTGYGCHSGWMGISLGVAKFPKSQSMLLMECAFSSHDRPR